MKCGGDPASVSREEKRVARPFKVGDEVLIVDSPSSVSPFYGGKSGKIIRVMRMFVKILIRIDTCQDGFIRLVRRKDLILAGSKKDPRLDYEEE